MSPLGIDCALNPRTLRETMESSSGTGASGGDSAGTAEALAIADALAGADTCAEGGATGACVACAAGERPFPHPSANTSRPRMEERIGGMVPSKGQELQLGGAGGKN